MSPHWADRPITRPQRLAAGIAIALLVGVSACGSDGGGTDADQPAPVADEASDDAADQATDDGTGDVVNDAGDDSASSPADPADLDDPIAAAPALTPVVSFAIDDPDNLSSVAMAPDGTEVAVMTQVGLGDPITITLYDAATGAVVNTTNVVDAIALSNLQWMADGRIVSYADREMDPVWRSWDAASLDELPAVALDVSCYTGKADRNTGIVYASDGLVGMGDDLCRFDTADGSVTRSGDGVLVSPESFWLVPGSGGVAVRHNPDPEGGSELVVLDGDSLAPVSSVSYEQGDAVQAVGATTWLSPFDGSDRLEPGAIPVPRLSPEVSDGGTVFTASNGSDDVVFVSAADGSVIGTMSAEWNQSFTSDWSIDDTSFVRVTLDGQAEIYEF